MWICIGVVVAVVAWFMFGWLCANIRDARITEFKQTVHQVACNLSPAARELTAQETYVLFCACQRDLRIDLYHSRRPIDMVAFQTIIREVSARAAEYRKAVDHDFTAAVAGAFAAAMAAEDRKAVDRDHRTPGS